MLGAGVLKGVAGAGVVDVGRVIGARDVVVGIVVGVSLVDVCVAVGAGVVDVGIMAGEGVVGIGKAVGVGVVDKDEEGAGEGTVTLPANISEADRPTSYIPHAALVEFLLRS